MKIEFYTFWYLPNKNGKLIWDFGNFRLYPPCFATPPKQGGINDGTPLIGHRVRTVHTPIGTSESENE